MANQYHDELGQFCSKSEMKNAINQAMLSGDQGAYLRLRHDYEVADADAKREKQEFIESINQSQAPKLINVSQTESQTGLHFSLVKGLRDYDYSEADYEHAEQVCRDISENPEKYEAAALVDFVKENENVDDAYKFDTSNLFRNTPQVTALRLAETPGLGKDAYEQLADREPRKQQKELLSKLAASSDKDAQYTVLEWTKPHDELRDQLFMNEDFDANDIPLGLWMDSGIEQDIQRINNENDSF